MPFSCGKPEHVEQVLVHALCLSNVDMAKVRTLDPETVQVKCERCDDNARYHIVPIKFGE